MLTSWDSRSTNRPSFCGLERLSLGQIPGTSVFPKMGQEGLPPGVFQTFELLGQGLCSLGLPFSKSDALERLDMADCRPRADTGRQERKPPTYPSPERSTQPSKAGSCLIPTPSPYEPNLFHSHVPLNTLLQS